MCVFFPFILDIKFVGRTSRGHTGGRSHRISHPDSFCYACLIFSREKDSAIPFPRRPLSRILCTNDLIALHPLGIFIFVFFSFLVRKIPFAEIELTSQRVRGLRGTSELPGLHNFKGSSKSIPGMIIIVPLNHIQQMRASSIIVDLKTFCNLCLDSNKRRRIHMNQYTTVICSTPRYRLRNNKNVLTFFPPDWGMLTRFLLQ